MIKSTAQDLSHGAYRLRISLFGYLQIEQDGQPLTPMPGQKVAALLAYLACNPGIHPRRQLAELFWAATPPERLLANLRSTLNRLPKAFKQYLKTTNESVAFEPTVDIWVDVLVFQALASDLPKATAKTTPDYIAQLNQIAEQLQTMVRLYKGAFLEGPIVDDAPGFVEWRLMQQSHLERFALDALRHLVYLSMQQGHYRAGIAHAERLIELDPLDEEARCQLMLLLAYCGEEEAARQVYQALVAMLDEEFGAPPAPETVAAYERVVLRYVTAAARTAALPNLAQPFIGRAAEIATLLHQLQQPASRLVTITGLGGMGKTYLAVEAARRIAERRIFLDGVVYVALAGLPSAARLPEALLQALGLILTGQDNLPAQICAYLAGKELLLIFDNFDHLLERSTTPGREQTGKQTAQQLVLQILQTAPQVKLLVTSRQPLSLSQEQLFPLGGLSLPPLIPVGPTTRPTIGIGQAFDNVSHADCAQGDAIQLFQQAALRNDRAFALTPANQGAVYRFCQWVQGMPLAIVLGAAQMGFLSPQELIDECQESLDLLETTWRDLPDRQQSLRVIFDYSWQRLEGSLQQIFLTLSVFHGGFTIEAVRQVAGASLSQLKRLAAQSLLVQTAQERYEMHTLLRHYAAEKLAEMASSQPEQARMQARHSQFYLHWLGEQTAALQGRQPFAAAATIHPDLHNIRQAWTYSVQQKDVLHLQKALAGFEVYCDIQGLYQEGIALIGEAIQALQPLILARQNATRQRNEDNDQGWDTEEKNEAAATYVATYCQLLTSQSYFCNRLGHVDQSLQLIESALGYIEQLPSAPRAPHSQEPVEQEQLQRPVPALSYDTRPQQQKERLLAKVYWTWGESLLWRDDFAGAKAKADQAVALAERVADQNLLAWSLHLRGGVYFHLDQFAQAIADIEQAHAISLRINHVHNQVNHLDTLGQIHYVAGKLSAAKGYLERALQISISLGDEQTKYGAYWTLCRIALKLGDYDAAEAYGLEALHFFRKIGNLREASYFYYDLGKLYNKIGLYREAMEYLAQGTQLAQKLGLRSEQAYILLEQSIATEGRGAEEEALTLLATADEVANEVEANDIRGDILTLSAALWRRRGHFTQSVALYQQALATYPTIPEYLSIGAKAGLARALQQSGDTIVATRYLHEVMTYLTADPENIHLLQTPFTTYLDCYHLLHAQQDPRAQTILAAAHILLHHHASHIHKPAQRRVFLEHVAVHRAIVELYSTVV
ncbi:MAG: BTAD domain-containing putative transcriptional regulator [Caldilineaceae bacterium]